MLPSILVFIQQKDLQLPHFSKSIAWRIWKKNAQHSLHAFVFCQLQNNMTYISSMETELTFFLAFYASIRVHGQRFTFSLIIKCVCLQRCKTDCLIPCPSWPKSWICPWCRPTPHLRRQTLPFNRQTEEKKEKNKQTRDLALQFLISSVQLCFIHFLALTRVISVPFLSD